MLNAPPILRRYSAVLSNRSPLYRYYRTQYSSFPHFPQVEMAPVAASSWATRARSGRVERDRSPLMTRGSLCRPSPDGAPPPPPRCPASRWRSRSPSQPGPLDAAPCRPRKRLDATTGLLSGERASRAVATRVLSAGDDLIDRARSHHHDHVPRLAQQRRLRIGAAWMRLAAGRPNASRPNYTPNCLDC